MNSQNHDPGSTDHGHDQPPPDTGEGHGSGLEQVESEPKQGNREHTGEQRPEDWNPPPGNPGSDQDSQVPRENGTAKTE